MYLSVLHAGSSECGLKIEQEKNPALKLRKKLETTGFDTVAQPQNYLKSINTKLKLWDEQIFINQVKKN